MGGRAVRVLSCRLGPGVPLRLCAAAARDMWKVGPCRSLDRFHGYAQCRKSLEEGTHAMLLTPVGTRNQDYRLFCHFDIPLPMGLYFRFGYLGIPQLSPVITDGRLIVL